MPDIRRQPCLGRGGGLPVQVRERGKAGRGCRRGGRAAPERGAEVRQTRPVKGADRARAPRGCPGAGEFAGGAGRPRAGGHGAGGFAGWGGGRAGRGRPVVALGGWVRWAAGVRGGLAGDGIAAGDRADCRGGVVVRGRCGGALSHGAGGFAGGAEGGLRVFGVGVAEDGIAAGQGSRTWAGGFARGGAEGGLRVFRGGLARDGIAAGDRALVGGRPWGEKVRRVGRRVGCGCSGGLGGRWDSCGDRADCRGGGSALRCCAVVGGRFAKAAGLGGD